jgi:hypothetical protein
MGSAKSASVMNDDGSPVKPPAVSGALTFKTDTNWGTNPEIAREKTSEVSKEASAVDHSRKVKKEQSNGKLDPDHPSAVSQDQSMSILDAGMAANPAALGNVLQKAMQSMVMLKMMDKLTSPAGILSMASGGMGGALQGLAGSVGLGSMLGALNQVMPKLSTSGLLNGSATDMLHTGMMGMMNNVAVGALAAHEVAAAHSRASTIKGAMTAIHSANGIDAIDAVLDFGGPAFGLTPGSLASKIAVTLPNNTLRTSGVYKGVRVDTTIVASPNPHSTARIPKLTGLEHVEIATTAVSNITGDLSHTLGVNTTIGGALGSISDITSGVSSGIGGALTKLSAFSHTDLGGIVNGGMAGVASGGIQKILGFSMDSLLSNATSLLPGIGGSITSTLAALPAAGANAGNLTKGLTNATKALGLSKAAHNVASNIFGQARSEAVASAVDSTANLAAAVNGPITMVTAFGDRITSAPVTNKLKSAIQVGAQHIIGSGQRI